MKVKRKAIKCKEILTIIKWTNNYDLEYIKTISLWRDLGIIFKTVFKVLKRSDIEREGTVSDIDYGDWLLQECAVTQEEYAQKQEQARVILKGE